MSRVFVSSDHHFGHAKIIEYCQRPFSSVQEMDEVMITQWNNTVDPADTVFVLGDYAMGDRERGLNYLQRLNGTKVLINGNHDKCSPVNKDGWKHQRQFLMDANGDERFRAVLDYSELSLPKLSERGQNLRVLLSHYPYAGDHEGIDDRYSQFRLRDECRPLLHGHIHDDAWIQRSPISGAVMFNLGVDVNGFAPVEATEIHRIIRDFQRSNDQAWDAPDDQFRKVKDTRGRA